MQQVAWGSEGSICPPARPPARTSLANTQGEACSSDQVKLCRSRCPHRALPGSRQGLAAP